MRASCDGCTDERARGAPGNERAAGRASLGQMDSSLNRCENYPEGLFGLGSPCLRLKALLFMFDYAVALRFVFSKLDRSPRRGIISATY